MNGATSSCLGNRSGNYDCMLPTRKKEFWNM